MNPLTNPLTSIAARALSAAFLVVMMFSLGLQLGGEPRKDKREKRHERRLLVRALLVNLVVLPLIAFALVRMLHGSGALATAVLLAAATPGGRFAPHLAKIARADLGLAVEITLFLTKLTGFTAPVTIRWLLGTPGIDVHDLRLIAQLFLLQMLPYVAGRRLRHARPTAADSLRRPLLVAEAIAGVALAAFLIARGELAQLASFGARGWASAGAFAIVSLAVGWMAGGHSPDARRAFAATAVPRNLGLGVVIAAERFGGTVQLALFAIGLMCLVVDVAFAAALGRERHRPQPQLAL